jgi:hypothetical protein
MPAPDSSEIDAALVARLQADPALAALMPDGVYFDPAPPGLKAYVIVSLPIAEDRAVFGGRAIEDCLYLIKAVILSSSGTNGIREAAARIDALLEDQPLTAAGYTWMTTHRVERVRYTEIDSIDSTIRWQHRGGRYHVQMAREASTLTR